MLTELLGSHILSSVAGIAVTISLFQCIGMCQRKLSVIWLQPMLLSILVIMAILLWQGISFDTYFSSAWLLNAMLEPAVVALGFPLYQHIETITKQWKSIIFVLLTGALVAIVTSFIITMLIIGDYTIAVALSLKSITTPIAIVISGQLEGNTAITAFAIILAGLFGASVGPKWLTYIKVSSPKAQGLAIGAASHAIGTATVSNISYEHAAYSSLALIFSAVITAITSPLIIGFLASLLA